MSFKKYIREMDESKFVSLSECVFDLLIFTEQVHVWHLQTGSYAQHMALADLYDGIPDIVDTIAEAMTGLNHKLTVPTKSFTLKNFNGISEVVSEINGYKDRATMMFKATGDVAGINNSLADLISLFDKTVYKLTNLN